MTHPSTVCAAFGCCEPPVNHVFEFCDRHARELQLFGAWLDDQMPIAGGGGALRVKAGDRRSSFTAARSEWAGRLHGQGV